MNGSLTPKIESRPSTPLVLTSTNFSNSTNHPARQITLSSVQQSPCNQLKGSELFFQKRLSRRITDLNKTLTANSPATERGIHVFQANVLATENKKQLNAMELRLKKLSEDQDKASKRVNQTMR